MHISLLDLHTQYINANAVSSCNANTIASAQTTLCNLQTSFSNEKAAYNNAENRLSTLKKTISTPATKEIILNEPIMPTNDYLLLSSSNPRSLAISSNVVSMEHLQINLSNLKYNFNAQSNTLASIDSNLNEFQTDLNTLSNINIKLLSNIEVDVNTNGYGIPRPSNSNDNKSFATSALPSAAAGQAIIFSGANYTGNSKTLIKKSTYVLSDQKAGFTIQSIMAGNNTTNINLWSTTIQSGTYFFPVDSQLHSVAGPCNCPDLSTSIYRNVGSFTRAEIT